MKHPAKMVRVKRNLNGSMAMMALGDRLEGSQVEIECWSCSETKPVNALDRYQGRSHCYDCRPKCPAERGL